MLNVPNSDFYRVGSPSRLWSFWDMQRLKLESFWRISAEFVDSLGSVYFAEAEVESGHAGRELTVPEQEGLIVALTKLKHWCEGVGLTASALLIGMKIAKLPKSSGEMDMIWLSVESEMKDRLFLHVPPHLARFYERDDVIPETARMAFPQANQELREAGNSISAGLPTACVFHSMRAVEYGLNSLAADVSVTVDAKNWQNVIDQIEKAIKDLAPTLASGAAKSDRLHFLSQAVSEFRYFKDGWRNHVAHNKVRYTEPQAIKIMDHAADFIEALSVRLQEAP